MKSWCVWKGNTYVRMKNKRGTHDSNQSIRSPSRSLRSAQQIDVSTRRWRLTTRSSSLASPFQTGSSWFSSRSNQMPPWARRAAAGRAQLRAKKADYWTSAVLFSDWRWFLREDRRWFFQDLDSGKLPAKFRHIFLENRWENDWFEKRTIIICENFSENHRHFRRSYVELLSLEGCKIIQIL